MNRMLGALVAVPLCVCIGCFSHWKRAPDRPAAAAVELEPGAEQTMSRVPSGNRVPCIVTNLAWMVGKWVWVEKRRRGEYGPSGIGTIERFCVFPYTDYTERYSSKDGYKHIWAESQAVAPDGRLTCFDFYIIVWSDRILVGGPGDVWYRFAYERDGEHEYLRLTDESSHGVFSEIVFLKVTDDPGKPLCGGRSEEHERAYLQQFPPINGEYIAQYAHGTETLRLLDGGIYEQVWVAKNGAASIRNSGEWLQDGDRVDLAGAMAFWEWNPSGGDNPRSEEVLLDVFRWIRGNVLRGNQGFPEYRQKGVKP